MAGGGAGVYLGVVFLSRYWYLDVDTKTETKMKAVGNFQRSKLFF